MDYTNELEMKKDGSDKASNQDEKQELEMIKELNIKAVNLIVKNKFEEALILLKKLEDIFEVFYLLRSLSLIRQWQLTLLIN